MNRLEGGVHQMCLPSQSPHLPSWEPVRHWSHHQLRPPPVSAPTQCCQWCLHNGIITQQTITSKHTTLTNHWIQLLSPQNMNSSIWYILIVWLYVRPTKFAYIVNTLQHQSTVWTHLTEFTLLIKSFGVSDFFKEIIIFIQQECIWLIKYDTVKILIKYFCNTLEYCSIINE